MFDLIAGTSTGGILALGLTTPDPATPGEPLYRAEDLVDLYAEKGHVIFRTSLWYRLLTLFSLFGSKYTVSGLDTTLRAYFGEARLKDAITEVLITSYDLESRDSWFLARHKARDDRRQRFPHPGRRTCDLGGADLFPAQTAHPRAADRDGRRRRVRQQPGDVRLRRGDQALRRAGHPGRLDRNRVGEETDPLPAGVHLGAHRMGATADQHLHGRCSRHRRAPSRVAPARPGRRATLFPVPGRPRAREWIRWTTPGHNGSKPSSRPPPRSSTPTARGSTLSANCCRSRLPRPREKCKT